MSDVLNTDRLSRDQIMKVPGLKCDITLLDAVDSTNEWALSQTKSTRDLPFACFAEKQTQGRGRRGRSWLSPSNSNIYMSLAWRLDVQHGELGALSIIMGMAVIRALEEIGIKQAKLKWPNDVLVNGKKIAGILIETVKKSDGSLIVIIGTGLNYNWPQDCSGNVIEKPDQPWTDIVSSFNTGAIVGHDCGRNYLAGLLLSECMKMCKLYPHNNESLIREYHARYDVCMNENVNVTLDNGMKLHGIAKGVTNTGEIRIQINEEEHVFNSADISLKRFGPEKTRPENIKTC